MSPWQLVGELGIYTEEQIEDMTWAECVEILEAEYQNMENRFNNMVEIERMLQFLDIQEVTTKRQKKNSTREFKLPIKDLYCPKGSYMHVASFASGYVRRTKAGGYSPNWQINKRIDTDPQYYETDKEDWCGRPLYRKYTCKGCELIPEEQDRLAYLISYCLKNYYIGYANKVARSSDEYIPKWKHEYDMENLRGRQEEVKEIAPEMPDELTVILNGHRYNVL